MIKTPKEFKQALRNLPPSKIEMPVIILAVEGKGGSGKTTFDHKLALKLGCEAVHTGDFASWENKFD